MDSLQQFVEKFSKVKCREHYHMTPTEYALWDICMGLSRSTRVLFFDGRKIAARFKGFSKDKCYRTLRSLVGSGWFEPLDDKHKRTRGGTYAATRYKVLAHDEWTAKYATNGCTVGTGANGDAPTVCKTGGLPLAPVQPTVCKTGGPPLAPVRHSLVSKPCSLTESLPLCETVRTPENTIRQEHTRVSDEVHSAVGTRANGYGVNHCPEALEYHSEFKAWGARRDIGRGLTLLEQVEMRRLNHEQGRPQQ